jgi:hypothetical protein
MAKRQSTSKEGKRRKVAKVMREFHQGKLRSSDGSKVTSLSQAKAIALSEAGQAKKKPKGKK